jgi:hypothetical protein
LQLRKAVKRARNKLEKAQRLAADVQSMEVNKQEGPRKEANRYQVKGSELRRLFFCFCFSY